MDTYYVDGEFLREDHASLSAKDITVLRGYGVFDFLVTYDRRPFYLEEHVARLENSAREIGLELKHTDAEICDIVRQTIDRNPHHRESNVRIVYSGGVSSDGVTPQGNGILMVMVTPKHELPDWWYKDGVGVITVDMERFIPTAKTTNYLNAVFAQQQAKKVDAVEAIYVDRQNRVLEGTTTNFFGFKGDLLITPPDVILPGITRKVVLDIVKDRFKVEFRHIDREEIKDFDEIFISASNKEIVPVIRVDSMEISSGRPGERTLEVMRLFREYTDAYGKGLESGVAAAS